MDNALTGVKACLTGILLYIFANASLQWLPDHYELFPRLVSLLAPHGVLAVQMPDNWLEPTHVLMREVAWEQNYPDRGREPLAGVHAYYDILSEAGCEVDVWRTTNYHQMPSHQAIIDWVSMALQIASSGKSLFSIPNGSSSSSARQSNEMNV